MLDLRIRTPARTPWLRALAQQRRKKEEDKIEQERRNDMIRQIRAIERVPKLKAKHFDPTTSSGQGLLQEMSLVELKERLRMVQARQKEEVVEKRKAILG